MRALTKLISGRYRRSGWTLFALAALFASTAHGVGVGVVFAALASSETEETEQTTSTEEVRGALHKRDCARTLRLKDRVAIALRPPVTQTDCCSPTPSHSHLLAMPFLIGAGINIRC